MTNAEKIQSPGGFTLHNCVQFIRGGSEYFSLLIHLINNAKEGIHLQTYIYDDDETGRFAGEALKKAVKRGAEVYLLVDGYASQV